MKQWHRRIPRTSVVGTALLAAGCLLACGDATTPRSVQRDSLGIRIVESAEPAWDAAVAWVVGLEPTLDLAISGSGEAHEFFRVQNAVRLPSGDIAVAMPSEIRIFSASGVHLRSLGREGEGPGEFSRLSHIEPLGPDSLLAFDYWQGRGTVFGPEGAVVRVFALDAQFVGRRLLGVGTSGFVAMLSWPSAMITEGPAGLVRVPVPVIRVSPEGAVLDTVTMAAGVESVRVAMEDGFADVQPMFGRASHLSVHRDQIVLGAADQMGYRIVTLDGKVARFVRADYDLRLTSEVLEAERNARLAINGSPAARRLLEDLPAPSLRPAYSGLQVDVTGAVWLEEHRGEFLNFMSSEPHRWEVFGPEGEWLGQVALPGRFTVYEIGVDHVLGLYRDDLDLEHVQLLPLTR